MFPSALMYQRQYSIRGEAILVNPSHCTDCRCWSIRTVNQADQRAFPFKDSVAKWVDTKILYRFLQDCASDVKTSGITNFWKTYSFCIHHDGRFSRECLGLLPMAMHKVCISWDYMAWAEWERQLYVKPFAITFNTNFKEECAMWSLGHVRSFWTCKRRSWRNSQIWAAIAGHYGFRTGTLPDFAVAKL